jgi:hypothetical protein
MLIGVCICSRNTVASAFFITIAEYTTENMEIMAMIVDVISGNSIVIIQASGALLEKRLWMIPGFEVVPVLFKSLCMRGLPYRRHSSYIQHISASVQAGALSNL